MDAIAVTLATDGKAVGLAPLGTSLTDEQAAQLHALGRMPVIATDADRAGRDAAERDYWILTPHGIDPLHAHLPDGCDPADLVSIGTPDCLVAAVGNARSLAEDLIDELLKGGRGADLALDALRIVAARPSSEWAVGVDQIADPLGTPASVLESALVSLTRAWNRDARFAARQSASGMGSPSGNAMTDGVEPRMQPRDRPDQQQPNTSLSHAVRPRR
jgi:DNA primase